MLSPIVVIDVPLKLGQTEAKRRLEGGIDRIFHCVPGDGANVSSSWPSENRMLLDKAMGQSASAVVDVDKQMVRIALNPSPLLAMMGKKIADAVRRSGEQLLLR